VAFHQSAIRIDDAPGKRQTPRDPALIRSRFMKGLGTGRSAALEGLKLDSDSTGFIFEHRCI
jgi:hypothetical protein